MAVCVSYQELQKNTTTQIRYNCAINRLFVNRLPFYGLVDQQCTTALFLSYEGVLNAVKKSSFLSVHL